MHFPIGSCPFQRTFPIDSLTTTTRGAVARSSDENAAAADDARPERGEVLRRARLQCEAAKLANRIDSGHVEAAPLERPEGHRDDLRRVVDAGRGARLGEQSIRELDTFGNGELDAAHARFDVREPIDVESKPNCPNLLKAANEEPCADEQHDGERGLEQQQSRPHPRLAVRSFACACLERSCKIAAPRLQGGQDSGERRGHHGQCHRERERTRVGQHRPVVARRAEEST